MTRTAEFLRGLLVAASGCGVFYALRASTFPTAWLGVFVAIGFIVGAYLGRGPRASPRTTVARALLATTLKVAAVWCLTYGLRKLGPLRFVIVTSGASLFGALFSGGRRSDTLVTSLLLICSFVLLAWSFRKDGLITKPLLTGVSGVFSSVGGIAALVMPFADGAREWRSKSSAFAVVILGIIGSLQTVLMKRSTSLTEFRFLPLIVFIGSAVASASLFRSQPFSFTPYNVVAGLLALFGCGALARNDSYYWPTANLGGAFIAGSAILVMIGAIRVARRRAAEIDLMGKAPVNPADLFRSPKQSFSLGRFLAAIVANERERKLAVFLLLTIAIMLLEFLYGVSVNSLGLISDSFHMMLDATSIAIGLVAAHAASWPAEEKSHPLGYGRYEVLGGFVNGVLLLFIALYVIIESVERIIDPPEIEASYLLLVSVIGLLINIVGVVFFHDSHGHSHSHDHEHDHGHGHSGNENAHVDHNMRGVYLHILADLLGSVSVIISSVVIKLFGFWIADPICSGLSAGLILISAFPLLEETGKVLLLTGPEDKQNYCDVIRSCVMETRAVSDIEMPKVWLHSTPPREMLFCTVAAKLRPGCDYNTTRKAIIESIRESVAQRFDISNVNIVVHLE